MDRRPAVCDSIANVMQIVQMQEITEIPEFPMYAKGVIDLRGKMIPVMDLRLRLGKMEAIYDAHTCIIVMNFNDANVGLIVDSVDEVAPMMKRASRLRRALVRALQVSF